MLINCPKCGFSQPKDKYCAQCGVDMESFKPKTSSGFSDFISNPKLHIAILLFVSFGLGLKFYQNKDRNSQEKAKLLKGSVQIVTSSQSSKEPSADFEKSDQVNPTEEVASEDNTAAAPTIAENVSSNLAFNRTGTKTTLNTIKKIQSTIGYYEVSAKELDFLIDESKNLGQYNDFGDYKAGVISNLNEKLTSHANQYKSLSKIEQNMELGRAFQWFVGTKGPEPDSDIGFHSSIETIETENQSLRANLEIIRQWKENLPQEGNPIVKTAFPATFEIHGDSTFFISGLLPRKTNLDNEEELLGIEPFKIIKSPRFKSEDSELVIFIQLKK